MQAAGHRELSAGPALLLQALCNTVQKNQCKCLSGIDPHVHGHRQQLDTIGQTLFLFSNAVH